MKTMTIIRFGMGMAMCCIFAVISACTELDTAFLEEEKVHLRVETRTGEDELLPYPLSLYAFDTEGNLVASISYESEEENERDLILSSGSYRIVALTGIRECRMPEDVKSGAWITLPDGNCLKQEAVMMGSALVTVSDADAVANLLLSHRTARMDLSLNGIPKGVKSVKVSLLSLPVGMDFEGNYSDEEKEVGILCTQSEDNEGMWVSPTFYVFPGQRDCLTFSIELTDENGSSVYGYTLNKKLEPGVPYVLSGNYMNGFAVDGNLTIEGWKPAENISFMFGNSAGVEDDEMEEPEDETFVVETIPSVCSIWRNHVVVAWQNATQSEADLLLISLDEWTGVSSANGNQPQQASDIAVQYCEGELTNGWHIPTKEEAKLISGTCGSESSLTKMNDLMAAVGGNALVSGLLEDEKGNPVRYLCNDAMNSYVVGKTGKQSLAGKSRTYSLRLVRTVHVTMAADE